jgi:hypothetical protein
MMTGEGSDNVVALARHWRASGTVTVPEDWLMQTHPMEIDGFDLGRFSKISEVVAQVIETESACDPQQGIYSLYGRGPYDNFQLHISKFMDVHAREPRYALSYHDSEDGSWTTRVYDSLDAVTRAGISHVRKRNTMIQARQSAEKRRASFVVHDFSVIPGVTGR